MSERVETEEEINRRHNEKMARRKAMRERMLATKTEERGLLIVHTGKGKGKSTAAFGDVAREQLFDRAVEGRDGDEDGRPEHGDLPIVGL